MSFAGYLVPFGEEIKVIAQLSQLITDEVLTEIKKESRIVAGRHARENGEPAVCWWYENKRGI